MTRRDAWMRISPLPVAQVAVDDVHGEHEATGDDPQYLVPVDGEAGRIQPGWYRLRLALKPLAGSIIGPCLYLDEGDGFSEAARLLLPEPDDDGMVEAVLLFQRPLVALRFDPSNRPARFAAPVIELRRLGRAGALRGMFADLRRDDPDAALQIAGRFARHLALRGPRRAAAALVDEYRDIHAVRARDYASWLKRYVTRTRLDVEQAAQRASALVDGPLVSVLLPVYDPPEAFLRECLDSVLAQDYGRWELCAVDDASSQPHVARVLADYATRDPRVRVQRRAENGHICAASNDALAMARGDWLVMLDHDDRLAPDALLHVAEAVAASPGLKLVYSDEDKLDARGKRRDPHFKPDWDPELLLGQNYICHLMALRADLVREVGGFRAGFEGAQDHDLLLRCAERLQAAEVLHLPRVLYHWRMHAGSTSAGAGAKPYAVEVARRAVAEHLERTGQRGRVMPIEGGHLRVEHALPDAPPLVSIIIPTRDRLDLLRTCIESLRSHTRYPRYELVVMDNGSVEPETLDYLAALAATPGAQVLRDDGPFNYSRLNNRAVAASRGEVLVLMNNDIEVVDGGWLDHLVAQAVRPGTGAVGALLHYPDDRIQHGGVVLGIGGVAGHVHHQLPRGSAGYMGRARVAHRLSAVTAACLAVRRAHWDAVGGLDEAFEVAFNDIDFCIRLRERGLHNVWTPLADLYHHESATRGPDEVPGKRERFHREIARMRERWGDRLDRDPYYNPNLSLDSQRHDLAFPPRPWAPPCGKGHA